ncbi:MAG: TolC family protein [Candidatus Dadabacteria bacterium]|nr:TolC family protein [Candidatus Dadabacteria bacterium]
MPKYLVKVLMFTFLLTGKGFNAELQLSLTDAMQIALENNHYIRAFKNSLSVQGDEVGIARSFLLPKITLEERFIRTDNPTSVFSIKLNQERFTQSDFRISQLNHPDPINDFQTSLSFEQTVLSLKSNLGLKIAKNEFLAKREELIRKKEEVVFGVVESYVVVQTAKEFVSVAEKVVEDAREHLRIANSRYKTGLGLYSDTLRASTTVAEAEQELVSARKNLDVAKRALGLLLGMSESVDTDDTKIPEITVKDIGYYEDMSLSRNDIKSLELRYKNAKDEIRVAESGYLPIVGIGASYQLYDKNTPFGAEGNSWYITAFLRWDLFDGARREYERAKAKYKAAEIEEQLSGFKKVVSFMTYESYLGVKEAEKNVELAEEALKTAEEGRRLVRLRYKNSLSPLIDLLDAQINLDRARANLVARKNEYQIAIAKLSFESGIILQDLGIEE